METIALRFSNVFAPEDGTINEHNKLINENGYVWYGKLGTPISEKTSNIILKNDNPRILLIESGHSNRYWADIVEISRERPDDSEYPEYYRDKTSSIKTWFKIAHLYQADKQILGHCTVKSSGRPLSEVSKGSMSSFFLIDVNEE